MHISGDRFCFLSIDISETKRLTYELKRHKEDLEMTVKARTAQLQEALEVKGRFLAVMSHGTTDRRDFSQLTRNENSIDWNCSCSQST